MTTFTKHNPEDSRMKDHQVYGFLFRGFSSTTPQKFIFGWKDLILKPVLRSLIDCNKIFSTVKRDYRKKVGNLGKFIIFGV